MASTQPAALLYKYALDSSENNLSCFIHSEILEEENAGSGPGYGREYSRRQEGKRESVSTVISPEYEREILQV